MKRITNQQLAFLIKRLNTVTQNPSVSWVRDNEGKLRAQLGNYHLYSAYGRVGVEQMSNEEGGVKTIIELGTKRETYNRLRSYLDGLGSSVYDQPTT